MQIKPEDLDKIRELAELQNELRDIKEREIKLRREVAFAVVGNRDMTPIKKTLTLGSTRVTVEFKEVLKIMDKDVLEEFMDDGTLPPKTVTLEAKTTLAKMKKVPSSHGIWDCVYTDISPTPTVKIETIE
jgi:hypothetical protein